MVTIYHNPRCTKSRQTLSLLERKEKDVKIVEYLKENPSAAELESILKKLKINAEELIRKGESIYKEKYKGKKLTEKQWVQAMVKDPILIERPIVVKGSRAVIGRPPENISKLY